MCVKVSLLVFLLCFFMHAYSITPPSAPVSHNKKSEGKLKFVKFGRNGRFSFEHNMPSKSTTEGLCKTIKGGASTADCKTSLHKALLQFTKSEDSRWRPLHVREMDVKYSSIFSEEEISETDYQPPHRKSPIHNK